MLAGESLRLGRENPVQVMQEENKLIPDDRQLCRETGEKGFTTGRKNKSAQPRTAKAGQITTPHSHQTARLRSGGAVTFLGYGIADSADNYHGNGGSFEAFGPAFLSLQPLRHPGVIFQTHIVDH